MQQIGEGIAEAGSGSDKPSHNDDVTRPVNANRCRSQLEPALYQRLGVADITAPMSGVRRCIDRANGTGSKNVSRHTGVLQREQDPSLVCATRTAARQNRSYPAAEILPDGRKVPG